MSSDQPLPPQGHWVGFWQVRQAKCLLKPAEVVPELMGRCHGAKVLEVHK